MGYVQIPKDLSKIKTKVVFNLTKRQLIGFSISGFVGIPSYLYMKNFIGSDLSILFMILITLPIFFITLYEKDGLVCEKYLKCIYVQKFYQPKLRISKNKLKLRKSSKDGFLLFLRKILKLEEKRYSVEDTLFYKRICNDGICITKNGKYNKVIEFEDINYELLSDEDRKIKFGEFSSFLNSFDSSVFLEISYFNQVGRNKEMEDKVVIHNKIHEFENIYSEFRGILKKSFEKIKVKKSRYITFGVYGKNLNECRIKLEQLENSILESLKFMGVKGRVLNGRDRVKLLHDTLNPNKEFNFNGDLEKIDTRSIVTPDKFLFKDKYFKAGKYFGSSSYFTIMASELSDRMLSEILSIEENLYISFHIEAINQDIAIKQIKRKNTDLQKMVIDEQQKAMRSGYDIDIIPSDLITYGKDIKNLLHGLQSKDEKLFMVSVCIVNLEKSKGKLDNTLAKLSSICNKHNCILKNLDYRQEEGLISVLPIGVNKINVKRELTTSSTAVFIPFKIQELFIPSKESLYYGINALSKNLIMVDRRKLKNPNGLILGTPGSGKSFSAKREIVNAILVSDDDILICDPENEYSSLVKEFNGEVINISHKSKNYLNPLDINLNYGEEPLKYKANFIISLLELVVDGRKLTAQEKSIIDRCLPKIYEKYFKDPVPSNMPTLLDLYNVLREQEEKVGKKLSTEMEIYVKGSLNVFNNRSNVDLNKKLLCFNIKELGVQLKKIGMLIIQDQVWNKVSKNRDEKRGTRYYIDEFHLLLRDEQTSEYSVEIWKRFRKWGGIPTGITQNVKDLFRSKEIENIFDNTDFILMLNQSSGDRDYLSEKLKISPYQLKYITNSNAGEGLLFFGNTIVPFIDKFPKDTLLYKKMTTKPQEVE